MIDLYYWMIPNDYKIIIFLEESGLPYRLFSAKSDSHDKLALDFLRTSPNNKIPVIVDHTPADNTEPLSLFGSGAILLYLADKIAKFIPQNLRDRNKIIEWLFWQEDCLSSLADQTFYFIQTASETDQHAINHYVKETVRLYAILDRRLASREFIADEYSIVDMASYPWIVPHKRLGQNLEVFPNLERWFESMRLRPAIQLAYAKIQAIKNEFKLNSDVEISKDFENLRRNKKIKSKTVIL